MFRLHMKQGKAGHKTCGHRVGASPRRNFTTVKGSKSDCPIVIEADDMPPGAPTMYETKNGTASGPGLVRYGDSTVLGAGRAAFVTVKLKAGNPVCILKKGPGTFQYGGIDAVESVNMQSHVWPNRDGFLGPNQTGENAPLACVFNEPSEGGLPNLHPVRQEEYVAFYLLCDVEAGAELFVWYFDYDRFYPCTLIHAVQCHTYVRSTVKCISSQNAFIFGIDVPLSTDCEVICGGELTGSNDTNCKIKSWQDPADAHFIVYDPTTTKWRTVVYIPRGSCVYCLHNVNAADRNTGDSQPCHMIGPCQTMYISVEHRTFIYDVRQGTDIPNVVCTMKQPCVVTVVAIHDIHPGGSICMSSTVNHHSDDVATLHMCDPDATPLLPGIFATNCTCPTCLPHNERLKKTTKPKKHSGKRKKVSKKTSK